MEIKYENLFENKAKAIKLLNLRIQNLFSEITINPKIPSPPPSKKQRHGP